MSRDNEFLPRMSKIFLPRMTADYADQKKLPSLFRRGAGGFAEAGW